MLEKNIKENYEKIVLKIGEEATVPGTDLKIKYYRCDPWTSYPSFFSLSSGGEGTG